jgi:hypothetical protein
VVTVNAKLLGGRVYARWIQSDVPLFFLNDCTYYLIMLLMLMILPYLPVINIHRSFFQSVCVIGYCLFPLVLVSVVSIVLSNIYIRLPLCGIAFAWASWASLGFLSDSNLANRRALGVYPLFLFYFVIAWMILIS